jgi:hypothetical protein
MSVDIPTPVSVFPPKSRSARRASIVAAALGSAPRRAPPPQPGHPYASPLPNATDPSEWATATLMLMRLYGRCSWVPIDPRSLPFGGQRQRAPLCGRCAGLIAARTDNHHTIADPGGPRAPSHASHDALLMPARWRASPVAAAGDFAATQQGLPPDAAFGRLQVAVQSGLSRVWAYEQCRCTSTQAVDFVSKLRFAFCAAAPDATAGRRRSHGAPTVQP